MKKANYYKVHLNKKPKVNLSNSSLRRTYLLIAKMTEFVYAARKCAIELKKLDANIPNYTKGGGNYKCSAIIGSNHNPEIILDKNGYKEIIIPNVGLTSEEVTKAAADIQQYFIKTQPKI